MFEESLRAHWICECLFLNEDRLPRGPKRKIVPNGVSNERQPAGPGTEMLAQRKGIAMKLNKLQILLPALLFVIACAYGQDVHYNYDRGANFQSYRTYQWVDLTSDPSCPPKVDVPGGLPNLPVGPPPIAGSTVSDDQLLDQ